MTVRDAITILSEMQLWRRGQGKYDVETPSKMPYSPREFGKAIDTAISVMNNLIQNSICNGS